MASAAICSVTILLLAMAVCASVSSASHPLAAVEATTDHAVTKEEGNLLPVHNAHDKEEMEEAKAGGQQGSAQEEDKKTGSYWGKANKLDDDDDDDNDDSDHDSDSDHDHDHDSDSDHDRDHDSDGDSDDNDDDDDDDHKSKNERKKNHAAQGRKGAPGSKRDGQLPKVVKKV
ncbi:trigger factor-like [Panicum virgatum]|uniref:Uncharacterized protein n=1 Tax=Panicum virgatum TaxID=38727 RepID=A0A8T0USF7_PANVG|nr:trigger factor-like [Panicum virgatum]KAG2623864.1 hypothetical protein PVAP13_3KG084700 [Panicum virgatum]